MIEQIFELLEEKVKSGDALKKALLNLKRSEKSLLADYLINEGNDAHMEKLNLENKVFINSDGASRGNPGDAGYGFIIKENDKIVYEGSGYLGKMTNNQAEYIALIKALEKAVALGYKKVELRLDSQLVVMQCLGRYKVKNEKLRPLYKKAHHLLSQFEEYELLHVPRAQNSEADRLANEGIDRVK